jgi:hypothetical protein
METAIIVATPIENEAIRIPTASSSPGSPYDPVPSHRPAAA